MGTPIDDEQWRAVRVSLQRIGDRFADLAISAPDPAARVTGRWSVADVTAHVVNVAWLDVALLGAGAAPSPLADLTERLDDTTVDDINDLNDLMLTKLSEREPEVLTEMLRDHIASMLVSAEGWSGEQDLAWVGGSRLPVAGLFAHLQNELLLHGYDLGRATGQEWPMTPEEAAPFLEMFILGLARHRVGRLLEGGDRPRSRRITVEFRSEYTTPTTLVLHEGEVSAEPPAGTPDVRLAFDPLTMTMMMFGRVSKARALASGRLKVGGRRPWLLPIFLKTFRVPR
jgi:hypothetical protein